jgi:hypothetical protein
MNVANPGIPNNDPAFRKGGHGPFSGGSADHGFDEPAPFHLAFPRNNREQRPWFSPPPEDAFPEWAACRGED